MSRFDTSGHVWALLDNHDDPHRFVWSELTPEMQRRVRALGYRRFSDVPGPLLAQIVDDCRRPPLVEPLTLLLLITVALGLAAVLTVLLGPLMSLQRPL